MNMKQTIKLRESELKRMITESVRRIINEEIADDDIYQRWEELKEEIGCEQMVDDISHYLSSDQLEQLIEYFNEDYDIWEETI